MLPARRPSRRRTRLRHGLHRFTQGLVVFGLLGLVISAVGLGTLIWTGASFGTFGDRISRESDDLAATLHETAGTLRDASRSALSFGRTLEETPPTITQAAETIRNMRPRLQALEAQAGAVDIFGARPLQGIGDLFGQIAGDLDGLDTQLDLIAEQLGDNESALDANARSLNGLANKLTGLADRVEDGLVTDSVGQAQTVLAIVLALLVAWMAVPAAGALVFGLWLRRALDLGRRDQPVVVAEL